MDVTICKKLMIFIIYVGMTLSGLYNANKRQSYLVQVYKMYEGVGQGSFGKVYRVFNKEDMRYYALKISTKINVPMNAKLKEVKLLTKIGDHDNIVKHFLSWEEGAVIFMQMELCIGSLGFYKKSFNNDIEADHQWDILIDMLKVKFKLFIYF